MKSAIIITVAGISSRFNQGFEDVKLKSIYFDEKSSETLLYKLIEKCRCFDSIIIVGGYKFEELKKYISNTFDKNFQEKFSPIYNEFFEKYSSGYSLFLGLQRAFKERFSEITFIEGDLAVDKFSFDRVVSSKKDVITYTNIPIESQKSVVVYKNSENKFRYAFNREHGLLKIDEAFSCIFNSGQCWKFIDIEKLFFASKEFFEQSISDTNLGIIQRYFDNTVSEKIELLLLNHWINCNTREDYQTAKKFWRQEKNEKF